MNNNRIGNINLAQLMMAMALSVGMTFLVARLAQNVTDTERKSKDGYFSVEMRDVVATIARDPSRWIPYQSRADVLMDSSVFSNCLKTGGPYNCPANDTTVDDAIQNEAQGRAVFPLNLYTPKVAAADPSTLQSADFYKIAGTKNAPAYFDRDGRPCTGGATDQKCLRMATAYLFRQNASGDPGAVAIIVKFEQNPNTIANARNTVKTSYSKINIGTLWRGGGTGPIPVGTIIPFAGAAAQIPPGFLPCNGAKFLQNSYPVLYSILGNRWTPPGAPAPAANEFYVPDLRGAYLRGLDLTPTASPAVDPDRATRTIGTFQAQGIADHTHAAAANVNFTSGILPASATSVPAIAGLATYIPGGVFSVPGPQGGGGSVFSGGGAGHGAHPMSPASGTVSGSPAFAGAPVSSANIQTTGSIASTVVPSLPAPSTAIDMRSPTAYVHYIIRYDY